MYFINCLNIIIIVKHEFSYFKTCICFHTEQLVTRILSNKYIWLLLKYKTEGTDSDLWRIPFIVSVKIKECYITETLLYQNKLFIL